MTKICLLAGAGRKVCRGVRFVAAERLRARDTQPVTTRSHHGTPQFVQPCPGAQVAAQAQNALQPRALAPCFCAVTHQKARNHKTSGFRVSWKIVPAVSDTWYPQPAQTSRLRLVIQLEVPRQRGQTKPSGPTQLKQVFSTRSFSPKSGLQFGQRAGVPLQRPLPQHIGLLESTKYPESGIWTLRGEGRNR